MERSYIADETRTLISALKMLQEDFTERTGSGIIIRLTDLEGKSLLHGIADEFCIAAEDAAQTGGLRQQLESRLEEIDQLLTNVEKWN
jgi:hypothetical protein